MMIQLALALAAIGHAQQSYTKCPIHVGTAEISKTWKIKNVSNCTFILAAGVSKVDGISISRFTVPSVAGWIEINGKRIPENITVVPHVEPFAILPAWSTSTNKSVHLNSQFVHVYAPETSYVSFGMAESFWLMTGEVVRDAYEAREEVYDVSANIMWAVHGTAFVLCLFVATIPCSWLQGTVLLWIAVSAFLDVAYWAGEALSRTDGNYGNMFASVTAMRVLLLAYLTYIVVETPSKVRWHASSKDVYRYAGGTFLLVYVIALLSWGSASLGEYPTVISVLYAVVVVQFIVLHPFMPLAVILTLFGITLNIGAGALVPMCMWCSYSKRYREQTIFNQLVQTKVASLYLTIEHYVGLIYFIYTVTVIASIAHPDMRKWTLFTVVALHMGGLAYSQLFLGGAYKFVIEDGYVLAPLLLFYQIVDAAQFILICALFQYPRIDGYVIAVVLVGCMLCYFKLKRSLDRHS